MGVAVSSASPETQPRRQAEITELGNQGAGSAANRRAVPGSHRRRTLPRKRHLRLLCRAFQVAPPTASAASPSQIR